MIFKRNFISLFIILTTIVYLFTCSPNPVEFLNPNDSTSVYYIKARVQSDTVLRIDIHSAELIWSWDIDDSNVVEIQIYRFIKNDSLYSDGSVFKILLEDITRIDSQFMWIDTSLTFERQYKYIIYFANKAGKSIHCDTLDYYHGFEKTLISINQLSDISIEIKPENVDNLADSMRYIWHSGSYNDTTVNLKPSTDFVTLSCHSGMNTLDENHFTLQYAVWIHDTFQWATVAELDESLVFPQVSEFHVVRWNNQYCRLSWTWESNKVEPESFIISSKTEQQNEFEPVEIVQKCDSTQQKILGQDYYVYYHNVSEPVDFQVQPETQYHSGLASHSTTTVQPLPSGYTDYYFIDESNVGTGFYISYYEVSNDLFKKWIKANTDHQSMIDLSQTDFDSQFNINSGYEKHPVHGIPYNVAQTFASDSFAQIPNENQWMLAATASMGTIGDFRNFPWGNDLPSSQQANYSTQSTVPVNDPDFESGRVVIQKHYNIYGAYHMAGNVMEWVDDSLSCSHGLAKSTTIWKNCKGGNYKSSIDELNINADFCNPVDSSDETIGFRLIKSIP